MSFSSVFVVSNALRLRFFKPKETETAASDAVYEENNAINIIGMEFSDAEGQRGGNTMKKRINVEGMMCQHCVKHVQQALEKVPGVESVDVSLEEKRADVTCTPDASIDDMKEAVTEAGYEVTGIEG